LNLSLRQLRVFEAVARHLSYTRAAEQLHLSQPAVSMQVRQLEEEIGLSLFERLGKGVTLTEAGREVFDYSCTIGRTLQDLEEVVAAMKGVDRGRLSIAVASTVNYFAPRVLAHFHQHYPGIELQLDIANRERLVRLLEGNSVDLVLMGQPPDEVDLESEVFLDNPLVIVAPPDHQLVAARRIPLAAIEEEVFVMREPGSGTRQALERHCAEHGVQLRQGMQMTRNEAVKQAVRAGLGLSVVSLHTIELEIETGRLAILDVEGFPLPRHWFLVYRRGKRLSPAARAFRDMILAASQSLASLAPLPVLPGATAER